MTKKKFLEIISIKKRNEFELFLKQYGPYAYQVSVYTCIILRSEGEDLEIKSMRCYRSEEKAKKELIKYNKWMNDFINKYE